MLFGYSNNKREENIKNFLFQYNLPKGIFRHRFSNASIFYLHSDFMALKVAQ